MEWTHVQCEDCWNARQPGREPMRMREPEPEPCCFCGAVTSAGICVRHDPRDLACAHRPGNERP